MLRRKVLLHILCIMIVTVGLFAVAYYVILKNYERLEAQALEVNQERTINALNREIENLSELNSEWASGGLLYYLNQPQTRNLGTLNVLIEVITGSFDVHKTAMYGGDGELVTARAANPDGEADSRLGPGDAFIDVIERDNILRIHDGATTSTSGLALIDGEIYLIASQPILETPESSTNNGSLITGSNLTNAAMQSLSETVSQNLEIIPVAEFRAEPGNEELTEQLLADPGLSVQVPVSDEQMDAYTLLPDYNGDHRFILRTSSSRSIMQEAERTMIITASGLLLLFVMLVIYISWFFDKNILRRLQAISSSVTDLADSDQLNHRLIVRGSDEISAFTSAFNKVMDSLEGSQSSLIEEKDKAETTLASIGDAVITTDLEGKILYMNATAETITQRSASNAINHFLDEVFCPTDEAGLSDDRNLAQRCMDANRKTAVARYCYLRADTADEVVIESTACPIHGLDGKVTGAVLVFRDVSEARSLQKNLAYHATHDALTGLFNRREFERRLNLIISNTRRDEQDHHLLFIDLDRFKLINDSCGHIAGDKVLREIAQLMKSHVRSNDILARIGGDEFGVILAACDTVNARRIAESLCEAVSRFRFQARGKNFSFGASIGLLKLDDRGDAGEEGDNSALSIADAACMTAKNSGRNRVHVSQPEDAQSEQRLQADWINKVTDALEQDRFVLYHQTIQSCKGDIGVTAGFEVLLRMKEEDGQIVEPGRFLPAAERYGLMKSVDEWVIRRFCEWLENNPDVVQNTERFFINLSGQSLSDRDFLDFLVGYLLDLTIPIEKLCFEITETAAIHNLGNAIEFISTLRARGCQFALDDFGSGMSSFTYLKQLPVDILKIDGMFIREMDRIPVDRSMVKSINDIAHVLGLKTVAEFVENESVLAVVKELGIDYAQGYHLHSPCPLQEQVVLA